MIDTSIDKIADTITDWRVAATALWILSPQSIVYMIQKIISLKRLQSDNLSMIDASIDNNR